MAPPPCLPHPLLPGPPVYSGPSWPIGLKIRISVKSQPRRLLNASRIAAPLTRTCVRLNWTVGDSGQREIVNPCAVTAINPVQLGSPIMQAIKLMITRAKTIKSFTVSRRSARRRALSVLSSVMARNVPSPIKETQQLSECSVPDTCPTRSRAIFCALAHNTFLCPCRRQRRRSRRRGKSWTTKLEGRKSVKSLQAECHHEDLCEGARR